MSTETLMQIATALRGIADRGEVKGFESVRQIVSIVNLLEQVAKTAEQAAKNEEAENGTD